jgi:hypothetical protein
MSSNRRNSKKLSRHQRDLAKFMNNNEYIDINRHKPPTLDLFTSMRKTRSPLT